LAATLTYIDSGVLIFAAKGTATAAALALPFLADPSREYVTSDYVRLEVLPKATFHKRTAEVAFYNSFFTTTTRSIPTSEALLKYALDEACKTGIHGLDALHVACAVFAGADEFITSEKTNRPIHRTKLVRVVSIFPREASDKKPWWKIWRW
jgi:predicted nucleic acid-binding protein